MKRLMIAVALCASALTGCVTATSPGTSVAAKADTVILTGERAFGVAELAYTTAANGVAMLVDAGLIHGATATKVRAINAAARELLVKGKATANAADKARIATQLFGLVGDLQAIKGSK